MVSMRNATAISILDTILDEVDAGSGTPEGRLNIYSAGSGVPNDVDVALTDQTLLAQIELANPAFDGAVTDGTVGARADIASGWTNEAAAPATGVAAFARFVDRAGAHVIQCSVGTSGTEVIINNASITATAAVNLQQGVIRLPDGGS